MEMWRTFHKAVCVVFLTCAISVRLLAAPHADRIIIHKKARTLELMHTSQVLKTYKVALGGEPLGPKNRQGDHRTPEGMYVIDSRNEHSRFHRSLHISYPNTTDRERAQARRAARWGHLHPWAANGYGFVGAAHRARDWTDGCVAVTDQEIEEIWTLVDNDTPVEIRP